MFITGPHRKKSSRRPCHWVFTAVRTCSGCSYLQCTYRRRKQHPRFWTICTKALRWHALAPWAWTWEVQEILPSRFWKLQVEKAVLYEFWVGTSTFHRFGTLSKNFGKTPLWPPCACPCLAHMARNVSSGYLFADITFKANGILKHIIRWKSEI